jgi:DNA-binding transcriptional LysR family regulator
VSKIDLNSVAVFVKIVEAGSFSGAARLLEMPTTTVSARFAALEKSLGVSLIQRTTRKLFVTEAGQRYFERCASAMRELDAGETEASASRRNPQGLLKITAPSDIGHILLPKIIDAYLRQYRDVRVQLIITNRNVDLIGEGVDLAIRAGAKKDSTLIARHFVDLTANLWATPQYLRSQRSPSRPEDLRACEFVAFGAIKSVQLKKGKKTVEVAVTGRIRADDFETVKSLILLGAGMGWLPDFLAADSFAAGLLTPALPGWRTGMAGQAHFVYPSQKYATPKVRAFIETALRSI